MKKNMFTNTLSELVSFVDDSIKDVLDVKKKAEKKENQKIHKIKKDPNIHKKRDYLLIQLGEICSYCEDEPKTLNQVKPYIESIKNRLEDIFNLKKDYIKLNKGLPLPKQFNDAEDYVTDKIERYYSTLRKKRNLEDSYDTINQIKAKLENIVVDNLNEITLDRLKEIKKQASVFESNEFYVNNIFYAGKLLKNKVEKFNKNFEELQKMYENKKEKLMQLLSDRIDRLRLQTDTGCEDEDSYFSFTDYIKRLKNSTNYDLHKLKYIFLGEFSCASWESRLDRVQKEINEMSLLDSWEDINNLKLIVYGYEMGVENGEIKYAIERGLSTSKVRDTYKALENYIQKSEKALREEI